MTQTFESQQNGQEPTNGAVTSQKSANGMVHQKNQEVPNNDTSSDNAAKISPQVDPLLRSEPEADSMEQHSKELSTENQAKKSVEAATANLPQSRINQPQHVQESAAEPDLNNGNNSEGLQDGFTAVSPFDGLTITLSAFPSSHRFKIRSLIPPDNYLPELSKKKTTHLIVPNWEYDYHHGRKLASDSRKNGEQSNSKQSFSTDASQSQQSNSSGPPSPVASNLITNKLISAWKWNITVVREDWIYHSLRENRRLPEQPYLVTPDMISSLFNRKKRKTQQRKMKQKLEKLDSDSGSIEPDTPRETDDKQPFHASTTNLHAQLVKKTLNSKPQQESKPPQTLTTEESSVSPLPGPNDTVLVQQRSLIEELKKKMQDSSNDEEDDDSEYWKQFNHLYENAQQQKRLRKRKKPILSQWVAEIEKESKQEDDVKEPTIVTLHNSPKSSGQSVASLIEENIQAEEKEASDSSKPETKPSPKPEDDELLIYELDPAGADMSALSSSPLSAQSMRHRSASVAERNGGNAHQYPAQLTDEREDAHRPPPLLLPLSNSPLHKSSDSNCKIVHYKEPSPRFGPNKHERHFTTTSIQTDSTNPQNNTAADEASPQNEQGHLRSFVRNIIRSEVSRRMSPYRKKVAEAAQTLSASSEDDSKQEQPATAEKSQTNPSSPHLFRQFMGLDQSFSPRSSTSNESPTRSKRHQDIIAQLDRICAMDQQREEENNTDEGMDPSKANSSILESGYHTLGNIASTGTIRRPFARLSEKWKKSSSTPEQKPADKDYKRFSPLRSTFSSLEHRSPTQNRTERKSSPFDISLEKESPKFRQLSGIEIQCPKLHYVRTSDTDVFNSIYKSTLFHRYYELHAIEKKMQSYQQKSSGSSDWSARRDRDIIFDIISAIIEEGSASNIITGSAFMEQLARLWTETFFQFRVQLEQFLQRTHLHKEMGEVFYLLTSLVQCIEWTVDQFGVEHSTMDIVEEFFLGLKQQESKSASRSFRGDRKVFDRATSILVGKALKHFHLWIPQREKARSVDRMRSSPTSMNKSKTPEKKAPISREVPFRSSPNVALQQSREALKEIMTTIV